jgi:UDP-N-acetylglucosamine 2-epimerase (non-hydrolysing)
MYDAILYNGRISERESRILEDLNLEMKKYLLATVHRPRNTDNPDRLLAILSAFEDTEETVVFPVHPRTSEALQALGYLPRSNVKLIQPVGYLDMLRLERDARLILTDSGGIQKEAYFWKVPCVTLRKETEWVETVESGWNVTVGSDTGKIIRAVQTIKPPDAHPDFFGDGRSSARIVEKLASIWRDNQI